MRFDFVMRGELFQLRSSIARLSGLSGRAH